MTAGQLVLAVDGGNSKTDVVVLRGDGAVLSRVRGQGSSPHQLGLAHAVRTVDDLVDRAWYEASLGSRDGRRAAVAAVFMAGADLPDEEAALASALERQGWAERTEVANDVHALLWSTTGQGDGVAVTVGAGVNCRGRAPDGRVAWFAALGPTTGDWGGGAMIGLAALGAGVRAEDRRDPPTALAGAVAEYFGCTSALEVAVALHQQRIAPERLMELSRVVVREAEAGDAAALAILHRQADEVTSLVAAALRQLEMERDPVDVALGGSVMAAISGLVLDRITASITGRAPRARVALSPGPPVLGAALAGLHYAGAGAPAAERLRAAWSPLTEADEVTE